MLQLIHLFVLVVTNSAVLFMLILLLGRTLWSLALNTTTIEGWEMERHETLLRRARTLGGHLVGPDGTKVRIERQEFPWDVGIWKNICQAMGTSNPVAWLWPFSRSPSVDSGLFFEHNGIEGTISSRSSIQLGADSLARSEQTMASARSRSNVSRFT